MSKFKNIASWQQASSSTSSPESQASETIPSNLVLGQLSRIRRGRKQYRTQAEEAHILQMMASIKEHGFSGSLPVIKVDDDPNHDYEYLGGHTTGEAFQRLGHKTALLSVETVEDDLSLAEFSYQLNGAGRPLNALDDTYAILDILSEARLQQGSEAEDDEIPALIRQIARGTSKVDPLKVKLIEETWERNKFAISITSFAASRLPLLLLTEDLKEAVQHGLSSASAIEINKIDDAETRSQLIDQAMTTSVASIKQAVKEARATKTSLVPDEWTPLTTFRSLSTKAKKIDFQALPKTKKEQLVKAISKVEKIFEDIVGN